MHSRSPTDICEAESGSLLHKAILLCDLGGNLEAVVAEWEYDDSEVAREFVALCREFSEIIEQTHLTDTGALVDAKSRVDPSTREQP
jgi:hypothetical protein